MLHKEAYKENDDHEHIYYIGLAYLNGIDVERNTEKGERTKVNYTKAIDYQRRVIKDFENIKKNQLQQFIVYNYYRDCL